MSNNKLPNGWIECKLEDIYCLNFGQSPSTSSYNDKGIGLPFFQGKAEFQEIYPKIVKYCSAPKKTAKKNNTLLSLRAPVGPTNLAPEKCAIGRGLASIRPICNVNYMFTLYLLRSYEQKLKVGQKGTTFDAITSYQVKNLAIKFPPLKEQTRIVEKIEKLFTNLDNSDKHLYHLEKQLKRYRQSVLKSAFEGELTRSWREQQTDLESADKLLKKIKIERIVYIEQEIRKKFQSKPEKWIQDRVKKENLKIQKSYLPFSQKSSPSTMPTKWLWANIESLVSFEKNAMKAGPFGSSLKKSFYTKSGYKIYGQEQVIAGDPFLGDYYVDEKKYEELITCKVQPKDVLISLVGTIGKVLILPHNAENGVINPRLIKLSFHNKYYLPEFFKYYFESSFLKSIYKIDSHGATMDIINMNIIKKLPFPLCSLKEQRKVINQIEKHFSIIDKLELVIQTSITESKRLRRSILKQAFAGKLIEQDPNDENAEELLKKIAKIKEKYKKVTTKRKKK